MECSPAGGPGTCVRPCAAQLHSGSSLQKKESREWQSFHPSQSRERGLACWEERTNPFPVNFSAMCIHMVSNPDSYFLAALEGGHGVTPLRVVPVATELPICAPDGSPPLIPLTR